MKTSYQWNRTLGEEDLPDNLVSFQLVYSFDLVGLFNHLRR